jgi:NAD(P)-dependent dehydrogenase (short-subunit alcohol dehydrogenase family)
MTRGALISRNRTNFDNDYPQLINALISLTAKQATIDGQIAARDEQGKSSLRLLQSYAKTKKPRSSTERLEAMRKTIHLARIGKAEDCVGAFLFLASPVMSEYITGQIIHVNGGQLMPG